jgi:hypothetical protein
MCGRKIAPFFSGKLLFRARFFCIFCAPVGEQTKLPNENQGLTMADGGRSPQLLAVKIMEKYRSSMASYFLV